MARIAFLVALVSFTSLGAGLAACVSSNSGPPAGSDDGGPPPSDDATIPLDSASGPDSAPGADSAQRPDAADAATPPHDAGTDATNACAAWTPTFAFDASAWDGAALSTASLHGTPLPGPAPTSCATGNTSSRLTVLNNAPCPIDVWWVDWSCEEDFYATVPPGESWQIRSYDTSVWRFRATGSEELLEEVVLPGPDDGGGIPTTIALYPSSATPPDAAAFTPAPEQLPDAAACTSWDATVEYDAGDWDGAPSPLANDAGAVPGPPATACSVVGDDPYQLMFVNGAGCPFDIYWVGYDCNEVFWQTVLPGETGVSETFATSVWRIRATGSGALLAQAPIVPEGADAGNVVVRYP